MDIVTTARVLGYTGLIPFIALAAVCADFIGLPGISRVDALAGLLAYGAVIVSFMSAMHWVHAMFAPWSQPRVAASVMAWSVLPALAAWFALWKLTAMQSLMTLCVCLLGVLYVDYCLRNEDWYPGWFWSLRVHLTIGAVTPLLIVALF